MLLSLLLILAAAFQPHFHWADGHVTEQGKGTFISTQEGRPLALTSAHFLDLPPQELQSVAWYEVGTRKRVAVSKEIWGRPGHEGCYEPLDLRSDYLLFTVEDLSPTVTLLQLDDRQLPSIGESVWFPDGKKRITGKVIAAYPTYILVCVPQALELNGYSGSPFINSHGKIIGILTGSTLCQGETRIYLAPAASIRQAVERKTD